MFTALERAEMKHMVMEEIRHIYMELVKQGQIYETLADQVLDHMSEQLSNVSEPELLLRRVGVFVQSYPNFNPVYQKLKTYQDEIVQKIGEESLELVMEEDMDLWSQLVDQVQELDLVKFKSWISTLPFKVYLDIQKFLQKRYGV